MIVTVRFFTTLREITKKRKEEIELPSAITVGDLMSLLSKKYGRRFTGYVYDEKGRTGPHLQFLVNGRNTASSQGLKTRLEDRDDVAIIPPVGGG